MSRSKSCGSSEFGASSTVLPPPFERPNPKSMNSKYLLVPAAFFLGSAGLEAQYNTSSLVINARSDPKNAPSIVAMAVVENPKYALVIVRSAVAAMPTRAVDIVRAVLRVDPNDAAEIVRQAILGQPRLAVEI